MIVPDECLAIARALIISFTARDPRQHEQRAENPKDSSSHQEFNDMPSVGRCQLYVWAGNRLGGRPDIAIGNRGKRVLASTLVALRRPRCSPRHRKFCALH